MYICTRAPSSNPWLHAIPRDEPQDLCECGRVAIRCIDPQLWQGQRDPAEVHRVPVSHVACLTNTAALVACGLACASDVGIDTAFDNTDVGEVRELLQARAPQVVL